MSVKNVNLLQLLAYPRMKSSVTIGFFPQRQKEFPFKTESGA
jgi:hypothetical protein